MPSAERIAGRTRRSLVAARYRTPEPDLPEPDSVTRAYEAESTRLRAAREVLVGPEPYRPRFTAETLPHPVPEKLKLGWRADAEVHGWYGGSESQLEYIEAQAGRISQLQKDLEASRRATHGAIAATLRERALNKQAATTEAALQQRLAGTRREAPLRRSRSFQPRGCAPTHQQAAADLGAAKGATQELVSASTGSRPPATKSGVPRDPSSGEAAPSTREASSGELAMLVSKQRTQMQRLVDTVAVERARCGEVEETLAVERERFAQKLARLEQKHSVEKRRADKASADLLRMRAERDQLEWLLQRAPSGGHSGGAESGRDGCKSHSVCEVCGKSVGLASTKRQLI
jgi:hypothetical protein